MINTLKRIYIIICNSEGEGKWKFIKLSFFSFISGILEAAGIGIFLPISQYILSDSSAGNFELFQLLAKSLDISLLALMSIIILSFFVFKCVFNISLLRYSSSFIFDMIHKLSTKVLYYKLNQPLSSLIADGVANFTADINNEVDIFCHSTLVATVSLVVETFILLFIFALLAYIDYTVLFFVVLSTGFIAVCYILLTSKKNINAGVERQTLESQRINLVKEMFGNIRPIKLTRDYDYWVQCYGNIASGISSAVKRQFTIVMLPKNLIELISIGTILLILVFLLVVKKMSDAEALGIVAVFLLSSIRIAPTVTRVSHSFQTINYTSSTVDRIYSQIFSENLNQNCSYEYFKFCKSIALDNISYHIDGKTIISNVSFEVVTGDHLAIQGSSGSGKSTLADIMLGLIQPTSGEIFINGIQISKVSPSWTQTIGYVTQEVSVINATIAENIAMKYHLNNSEIQRVAELINQVSLNDMVNSFEKGLNTPIGDCTQLSGGQKQRIAIARALYRQISVLILDEATSALDINTENEIAELIKSINSRIIVVSIAHRVNAHKYANKKLQL